MPPQLIDAQELKLRLEPLIATHPGGGIVFDADGTLFPHDVGTLVFDEAVRLNAFKDSSQGVLLAEALKENVAVPDGAGPSAIAKALEQASIAGEDAHRRTSEMQVWAYVDFTEDELRSLAANTLAQALHTEKFYPEIISLIGWLRGQGVSLRVVSASPRIIVEEATRHLGFHPSDIAAGSPRMENGRITVGLSAPLPFAQEKAISGRALLKDRPWLATFGDSWFDLAMMQEAQLAVGVGSRASMLEGLCQHPNAVRLKVSS